MTETDQTDRIEQVEAEIRASFNLQALVDHYMKLTYRVVAIKEDSGGYTVSHPELAGCYSFGDTIEEALAGLHEAKALWVEGRLGAGREVPEPRV